MRLFFDQLDLQKTKQNWPENVPFQPALVKKRARDDRYHWQALDEPLKPGAQPVWALAEHDEYVRVPLFPYVVSSSQADRAIAFALQLGLTCAGYLPDRLSAVHIITGVPVQLLYDAATNECAGMKFWIGLAVTVEKT